MTRPFAFILIIGLLGLAGCGTPTPTPDYAIKVARTPDGRYVAIPPACPSWSAETASLFDNQPIPQFGCANQRNLALMVDNPEDLLQGQPTGPGRGETAAGSILRYDSNQTRGLVYISQVPDTSIDTTTASTAASGLSGETPPASSSGGSALAGH